MNQTDADEIRTLVRRHTGRVIGVDITPRFIASGTIAARKPRTGEAPGALGCCP